ncbi:MAG TPA: AI-2E family transporter [Tepidisphaeraceae bacterium]|jgi:predicted PurR-regulated permease PerM
MPRLNARWLALLAITLIALYLCWLIIAPFLDVILWAVVLAIITYPYHLRLRRRGLGRNTAALIATLGVCLVVLVPVGIVMSMLVTQIPDKEELQKQVVEWKSMIGPDSRVYKLVDPYVDLDRFQDPEAIKQLVTPYTQRVAQGLLGLAAGLAGSVVSICFALFTLFYLLRDNHKIGEKITDTLPLEREQSLQVFQRCQEIIQASVQGVLLIAAIQAALGALAFWLLGVPGFVLWGVVMFVMSMIPALGSFIVWVPAAIWLGAQGQWWQAVAMTVWGGAVIGSVDNFLRPRLVGQKTGMHDLVIFFSVLGGLQVFGILGLFVGPVVVALAVSIVEVFKQVSATTRPEVERPAMMLPADSAAAVASMGPPASAQTPVAIVAAPVDR